MNTSGELSSLSDLIIYKPYKTKTFADELLGSIHDCMERCSRHYGDSGRPQLTNPSRFQF